MGVFTLSVRSDGQAMDPAWELVAVDVLHEVDRIPRAHLTLNDGDAALRCFAVSDGGFFEPGRTIEVAVRWEEEPASAATLFKGLVVGHAVEADAGNSLLSVELKDAAVKLTQLRVNRVFFGQSDDQALRKLLGLHGLTAGTIPATTPVHEELVQYGCTDWDFLLARAQVNGLLVKVRDGSVTLAPMQLAAAPARTFEYGMDAIIGLEVEARADGQYGAVEGLAWDVKGQQMSTARRAKDATLAPGNLKGATLAAALGADTCTLTSPAVLSEPELQSWADATLARSRLALVRGRLTLEGRSDVDLLDTIAIKGVGQRFNGHALVTGVRQRISAAQGWLTDLQFGLAPAWLAARHGVSATPAAGLLPAVSGLQIGVVAGFADDPQQQLRVKVTLPALGATQNTVWARLAAPDAGKGRGFCFRPESGDEVVVGFFDDDPRQPVILGALYSAANSPAERFAQPTAENIAKGLTTRAGTTIGFDDEKCSVYIETPAKNTIVVDDQAQSIRLADQHGNTIVMDAKGIEIASASKLVLKAAGEVTVTGTSVDLK